ncbi:unnamed protein product, partial [Ectocarpus fasciculatus]
PPPPYPPPRLPPYPCRSRCNRIFQYSTKPRASADFEKCPEREVSNKLKLEFFHTRCFVCDVAYWIMKRSICTLVCSLSKDRARESDRRMQNMIGRKRAKRTC